MSGVITLIEFQVNFTIYIGALYIIYSKIATHISSYIAKITIKLKNNDSYQLFQGGCTFQAH